MLAPRPIPGIDDIAIRCIEITVDVHCRRFQLDESEQEDLFQEVSLHLLEHASSFNPTAGAWSTFVKCVACTKLAMIQRDSRVGRRGAEHRTASLSAKTPDFDGCPTEWGDMIEEGSSPRQRLSKRRSTLCRRSLRHDVDATLRGLPADQASLCQALRKHRSVARTAARLRISRSTIYRRRERSAPHSSKRDSGNTCDQSHAACFGQQRKSRESP